jgi:uncharacterized protein YciI
LIKHIRDLHLAHFKYANYLTNANPSGENHLDKLTGMYQSEKLFTLPFHEFENTIKTRINVFDWEKTITPYQLYQ